MEAHLEAISARELFVHGFHSSFYRTWCLPVSSSAVGISSSTTTPTFSSSSSTTDPVLCLLLLASWAVRLPVGG